MIQDLEEEEEDLLEMMAMEDHLEVADHLEEVVILLVPYWKGWKWNCKMK